MDLYCGDCRDVLKTIPDNSIDSVVTDPPYELGFMGKKWDNSGIAYDVEMWGEVLRVLKPGGFLLSFGGTRTSHRMVCAIEDAGFEIRDSIHYVYGSGFPKSLNIEKVLQQEYDKRTKKIPEHSMRPLRETDISQAINLKKESGEILQQVLSEQSSQTEKSQTPSHVRRQESSVERRSNILEKTRKLQTDQVCDLPDGIYRNGTEGRIYHGTQIIDGAKVGEVVTKSGSGTSCESRSARQPTGKLNAFSEQQIAQTLRTFKGWGTALKPAHEPICVARKPIEGTVAQNVLKYGTGGINIDGCRVDWDEKSLLNDTKRRSTPRTDITGGEFHASTGGDNAGKYNGDPNSPQGRFPANFIHDGSKVVVKQFPVTQSGSSEGFIGEYKGQVFGKYAENRINPETIYADKGSASRFFKRCEFTEEDLPAFIYCAKASKSERDEGCDEMNNKDRVNYGGFHSEKGLIENNRNPENRLPSKNNHPTVKPVKLMQYLVKLITRPGGTVLDPFMGSGTTGVACKKDGYEFIGIEMDAKYFEICEARIGHAQLDIPEPTNQLSLF